MTTIRCITFDLDDTLWECWPIIEKAEKAMYEWLNKHFPRVTNHRDFDTLLQHRIQFVKDRPNRHHNLTQLRKDWLSQLAHEHNYPKEACEEGYQVFWLARNEVVFLEGILNTLERLSSQYSLGVITNGNADVAHIGVGHLFDFSIKSEDAGVAKPHPDIFHLASQYAKVPTSQILHVGDDPIADIKGAQAVGMKTLWVNYAQKDWKHDHQPDAKIHHQGDLETTIRSLVE
ncbi:MAG: Putative FMN hydrolase (EC; 5-Amino-6-(5'-phosphoribitylamino)uracil phosphatase [uncultured Thiotrichaceae bacterium]|uniref:FMN hydrolase uracil phosphatase) n=1 Tax=uncultured Thiotrichaceae bacterium TaxID=298394 RepID=A0A6S6S1G3_9GAMM|nr:MAG: Putative FMN hydrolase (EC; 5-Amino-6-(5'-phosphoribitylamino)uracil phosphatase [uncultured Thiotrichaceae bacterium]